jgi:hypothetical protein
MVTLIGDWQQSGILAEDVNHGSTLFTHDRIADSSTKIY